MQDKLGFLLALLSLLLGMGEDISEAFTAATEAVEITYRRAERILIPYLATLAQRTLAIAGIILAGVVGYAMFLLKNSLEGNASQTFMDYWPFIAFVVLCLCAITVLFTYLDEAKTRPLFDENGNALLYPETIEGTNDPHPRAGEQRIDEERYHPDHLSLSGALGTILVAFIGSGVALFFVIAHDVQSRGIAVLGWSLIFAAIGLLYAVFIAVAWAISRGSTITAFVSRLGLSQALIPFMDVTSENINNWTRGVQGIPWYRLHSGIAKKFAIICIPLAVYAVITTTFLDAAVTAGFTAIYVPILVASLINAKKNPFQEERRQARMASSLVFIFVAVCGGAVAWSFMSDATHARIKQPLKLLWSFLLGNDCLPAGDADWLKLLVSTVGIFLILWATKSVRAEFPKWAKISVGTATVLAFLFFPVRYSAALLAEHSGEKNICMPYYKPATGTVTADKGKGKDKDNVVAKPGDQSDGKVPHDTLDQDAINRVKASLVSPARTVARGNPQESPHKGHGHGYAKPKATPVAPEQTDQFGITKSARPALCAAVPDDPSCRI